MVPSNGHSPSKLKPFCNRTLKPQEFKRAESSCLLNKLLRQHLPRRCFLVDYNSLNLELLIGLPVSIHRDSKLDQRIRGQKGGIKEFGIGGSLLRGKDRNFAIRESKLFTMRMEKSCWNLTTISQNSGLSLLHSTQDILNFTSSNKLLVSQQWALSIRIQQKDNTPICIKSQIFLKSIKQLKFKKKKKRAVTLANL